jgi:GNAT superfamily N-acetyltransferase
LQKDLKTDDATQNILKLMNLREIIIEAAQDSDFKTLTDIAFAAKRHWNYPDKYYEIWKDELTITKEYINENLVFKAIHSDTVLGFYSIVENKTDLLVNEIFVKKGFWLEHIFLRPEYHKMGAGRCMIEHAKTISKNNDISNLLIFADPFAKGFYDKIGADFLYNSKSSIPDRLIPVYNLVI